MKQKFLGSMIWLAYCASFMLVFNSCTKEESLSEQHNSRINQNQNTGTSGQVTEAILMVLDEDAIDNGAAPNYFSETDVNDNIAELGQRTPLKYFRENTGKTIDLYSGDVGDEGWFAIKTIPATWKTAGPGTNGSKNFLNAGPGLGTGNDGPENLLDKIQDVTPLRANGLKMLEGKIILAVVFDGDASINYSPLEASLKGANLGIVALQIINVAQRTNGSSSSLPRVSVKIISVDSANAAALKLFSNAPAPRSSSEPFDIAPQSNVPVILLTDAL